MLLDRATSHYQPTHAFLQSRDYADTESRIVTGESLPPGRAKSLAHPLLRGHPATPREGECGRGFRDGLKAGREASGARRGDPRCPDTPLARVPAQDRTSLYDEITTKIIGELEAGRVPWVQPWGTAAAKAPLAMPKNAATGRQYSGINVLILWGVGDRARVSGPGLGHLPPGAVARGQCPQGRARHHRRLCRQVRARRREKRAQETGEEAQAIPFLKRFTVFNTDNAKGCPKISPSPRRRPSRA